MFQKKGFTISCVEYYFRSHATLYIFIPQPVHLVYNIHSIKSDSQKNMLRAILRAWTKIEKGKKFDELFKLIHNNKAWTIF